MPIDHTRWGLANTAHSHSLIHVDGDGTNTAIAPQVGSKLWYVASPRRDHIISSPTDVCAFESWDAEGPNTHSYKYEAVLLQAGDVL
jgi:hypothetical protein